MPWRDRSFRFSTSLHFEVCAVFWPSPVHFACVAGSACLLLWAFVLTLLLFLCRYCSCNPLFLGKLFAMDVIVKMMSTVAVLGIHPL
jgi:hypothetical protein